MNHLSGLDRLANRFSIMRHGQSKANARGLIVSRIENDRRGDYGLSELGRQQALAVARGCGLPGNTASHLLIGLLARMANGGDRKSVV